MLADGEMLSGVPDETLTAECTKTIKPIVPKKNGRYPNLRG